MTSSPPLAVRLSTMTKTNAIRLCSPETDFRQVDVEAAAFPAADGDFDLVIWNRELVTVKNLGPALREVQRVLRPGGVFVVAVPNLAALHNRLLLLAGRQPTTLHIGNGDHVRGFTIRSMTEFLTRDLDFELLRCHRGGPRPSERSYPAGPTPGHKPHRCLGTP